MIPPVIKYFLYCEDNCEKDVEMTFHKDKDGVYLECTICKQLYKVKNQWKYSIMLHYSELLKSFIKVG